MRARKFFLFTIGILAVLTFLIYGVDRVPVEKVSVASVIGYDIESQTGGITIHSVPITIYNISENIQSSKTYVTRGKTLAETREDRQRKIDRKFVLGFEKVYMIGETAARHGIKEIMDILIHNSQVNDTSLICVCKGKAEDVMNMKLEGYPSSGDFIEGLIRNSRDYNFFPRNYKLIDLFLRLDAEGRNAILPCIEIKENTIQITGLAVFNKEKLIAITNLEQAKVLNILKESDIRGMITIEEEPDRYVNFYGKSKRKVQCYKEGDSYRFVINLNIKGDIVANERYENIINDPGKQKKIEELLSKEMEAKAKEFIKMMQTVYKTDCLELGRAAAAKYGRNTGVDWDEIVTNSQIEVNAKVTIDKVGRGDY